MSSKGRKDIGKFYRLNERIQAPQLRVVDADGTQLGVISRDEATAKARAQELDLVEVAPNAQPPVARILDFQKFKYEESKKEQAARKHAREVEQKEIWLSPRIASHDLDVRLKKADEFLGRGDKIKLTVKFKGREMAHPENGHVVLNQALSYFGDRALVEREPKFEGRSLTVIIGPSKGKKKEEENAKVKNQEIANQEN
ncbi:translation initiation factor IF-3 [Candidatus Daviesbacteria bacterium]|nr:translation initiation factor IF-3 [Candidatus Daviesbacteria bacterium]